jgi:hypothetical protein
MSAPTLEELAQRLDAVEKTLAQMALPSRAKNWRRVVGLFSEDEFMKQVIAEGNAIREADREGRFLS